MASRSFCPKTQLKLKRAEKKSRGYRVFLLHIETALEFLPRPRGWALLLIKPAELLLFMATEAIPAPGGITTAVNGGFDCHA